MPEIPPPPSGFKLDAPPPPPGYKLDLPGSVLDNPTTGQRLKRVGKALVPLGAGLETALTGARLGGELGGPVGAVAGAAVGGLAAPLVESATKGIISGQPVRTPSLKESVTSAAVNAAFTGLSEAASKIFAGRAAKVAGEITALPQEAQTAGNIKQALRNREMWTKLGFNDQQVDEVLKTPDLINDVARIAQAGKNYKQAFQTVLEETRKDFGTRYDAAYGSLKTAPAAIEDIGAQMEQVGQGAGQHELTPTFRGFLQRKGLELTKAGESGGPSVGGVPWKQLPQKLKEQIRAQGGIKSETMTVQDIRDLRTELRENLPAQATPLDRKVYQQFNEQLTQRYEQTLREAGATPEQLGSIHALDEEWARFSQTLKALDPRSERYGTDVANALFDPMLKNPNDAMNFIRMAKLAEDAKPGEVMPQIRAAFKDKLIADTKVAAQGRPVEEMRLLQKMQAQWGGQRGTKAVLTEMFGGGSPLSDPTKMATVLGKLANPDQAAADASSTIMKSAKDVLKSPGFLTRLAVTYGMYRAVAGGTGSPWKDLSKPEVMIPALATIWLSGKAADLVFGASDRALQKAYVDFVTNPDATSMQTLGRYLGGGATAITASPSENPK